MPKVTVYKQTGEKGDSIDLPASIFDVEPKEELIHQALVTQTANSRKNIAHTKVRSEVRGGGAKPWRQKGTGRARAGSRRSPIWVGGGITFGPRNDKNYSKKMNNKAARKALLMTLTSKLKDKQLVVVEDLSFKKPATKEFAKLFGKLPVKDKRTLFALAGGRKEDKNVKLSARNLPKVSVISANSLNVRDLLNFEFLLLSKSSIKTITETFDSKKKDKK